MNRTAEAEAGTAAAAVAPGCCSPGDARRADIHLPEVRGRAGLRCAIFSPDRRLLCLLGDGTVAAVVDLDAWTVLFRFEHEGKRPRCACFSPDSRTLVTGDSEGTARFWALDTGQLGRELTAPVDRNASDFDGVSAIAWSPDGASLAIGRADGMLWLCSQEDPPRVTWLPIPPWDQGARALIWALDGRSVFAALASGQLARIDATSGSATEIGGSLPRFPSRLAWQKNGLLSILHDGQSAFAAMMPGEALPRWRVAGSSVSAESSDGALVLVGEGSTLELRRSDDGSIVSSRTLDEGRAHAVAFGPGGEWIVGVSGGVLWLDGDTEARVAHPDNVMFVAPAPGCAGAVLFAGEDGVLAQWCAKTQGQPPPRPKLEPLWSADVGGFVGTVELSPDGTRVLTAGDALMLWDARTGHRLAVLKDRVAPSSKAPEHFFDASWSPSGDRLLVVDHNKKTASLWDPETAKRVTKLDGRTFQARFVGDAVVIFTFMSHKKRLLSGLVVADARTGALRGAIPPGSSGVHPLAVAPDASHMIFNRDRAPETPFVIDLRNGKALSMGASPLRAAAFSRAGRLAAAHADGLWFWDLDATSSRVSGAPEIGFRSVDWSPDGQRLAAVTDDGGLLLFNAEGKQIPLALPEMRAAPVFTGAFFGPQGALLAATARHVPPVLWRAVDGSLLCVLEGSRAAYPTLTFSPRGDRVATYASSSTSPLIDPVIRLFDREGALVAALTGVEGYSFADVIFSLDGEWLLAAADSDPRPNSWRDPRPCLWRTADGEPAGPLEGGVGEPRVNIPLADGWLTCCNQGKLRRWGTPEML